MCLSNLSFLRSLSTSSSSPARVSRYQNILLLENGTPRRYEPGCGLMPTKSILAFFETLYAIKYAFLCQKSVEKSPVTPLCTKKTKSNWKNAGICHDDWPKHSQFRNATPLFSFIKN